VNLKIVPVASRSSQFLREIGFEASRKAISIHSFPVCGSGMNSFKRRRLKSFGGFDSMIGEEIDVVELFRITGLRVVSFSSTGGVSVGWGVVPVDVFSGTSGIVSSVVVEFDGVSGGGMVSVVDGVSVIGGGIFSVVVDDGGSCTSAVVVADGVSVGISIGTSIGASVGISVGRSVGGSV